MKLQPKLDERRAQARSKLPAATFETMIRATGELRDSGLAQQALKAGDKAPDFALPDIRGKNLGLREIVEHGSVVLNFFRGVW